MTANAAQTAAAMPKSALSINLNDQIEAIAAHQAVQNLGVTLPASELPVVRGRLIALSMSSIFAL